MADQASSSDQPYYGGADYGVGSSHPVQADIPANAGGQRRQTGGLATAALALVGFVLKFKGLATTFITTGLSVVVYAQLFGWWVFALGFTLLLLIHETGHLVTARAMGLKTGLPIMIPGLGALVNIKQPPRTVAQEAQIGISGPLVGTVVAVLCYLGYVALPDPYWSHLLGGLAYFGFLINLFNLIPVTPLDGGRVLSILSKWFNVAGLAIALALLFFTQFRSPVLLLVVIFGAISTWGRFRSTAANPEYYQVPASTKWTIGALYLALLLGLALGVEQTSQLLHSLR